MKTLHCRFFHELEEGLVHMANDMGVRAVLCMMTNDSEFPPEMMSRSLRQFTKPILGGVFADIIYENQLYDSGLMLLGLPFQLKTEIFEFDKQDTFERLKRHFSDQMNRSGSVFVFTDAFSDAKTEFVESLFNFFGFKISYLGAGCGTDTYRSLPCILCNDGVFSNAAAIGYAEISMRLGIAHGWKPISSPMKVTEAIDNRIQTLNWEPAFEVFREIVEAHSGKTFDKSDFLDMVKSYPIGMNKMDDQMVVRDPFAVRDQEIHCLDRVATGQYISILHGSIESLLRGAAEAARDCHLVDDDADRKPAMVFCVDCISRVRYLSDDYRREIDELGCGLPVYGVVSFGEIANRGHSFLEIYNKTVIVAKWEQIQ